MSTLALVLADDHPAYRAGLADVLRRHSFSILGEADDAPGLIGWLARAPAPPDVVLMDVQMPGGGPAGLRALLAAHPALPVLALSMHDDPAFAAAMLAAGARGYMLKDDPLPELVAAIRGVAAGARPLSPMLTPPQQ